MSSLTRSASKFLSYSVGLLGFIVLSTSNLAAEDELDSSGQSDLEMDLAFVSLILFSWADVKGSTTVGTDDRDSPDDSQTALVLDANVAIPLSRITGPQTQLILGGMGGGFVGSGWDARLDLDPFINGFDTRISGDLNGFGGGYAGIRQAILRVQQATRDLLVEFEVRGGGGAVGSNIQGTTQFGGGNDIRFSEDETLGFVFGEASVIFRRETASGAELFGKFGVGVMDIEDTSFNVKAPFGDARIDIENDASVFISFEAGLRFSSDRRLKRDIRLLATRSDGLRLYASKYLWGDETYVGVMAQDLLASEAWRSAVSTMANGYYAVDYGRLGLRMLKLEAQDL